MEGKGRARSFARTPAPIVQPLKAGAAATGVFARLVHLADVVPISMASSYLNVR